ncbi:MULTISPECIES: acyltransferase [unclassified Streptomyces]|uniref:acyltransferase n=1 Tax=unclassified Streptomyces TaxID=2593676 RepID=UPI00365A34C9
MSVKVSELLYWNIRYRTMQPGSPAWHRRQESLGRKAPVEPYMSQRAAFYEGTMEDFGAGCRIYPGVCFHYPKNISVGEGVVLNRGVHITSPVAVTIGDRVLIGPYAVINSGNHEYRDRSRPIRGQGHTYGEISIGHGAWLGAHVVVLPGVTIGAGAIVGAGAVVTKDVASFSIVGGVPASAIGER